MLKEFREFVARGNVIDLAVGVIMGAAFGRIVTTLVEGVRAMAKSAARQWAPSGVRVNLLVLPLGVLAPALEAFSTHLPPPPGGVPTEEHVGAALLQLLQAPASMIGATVVLDGGSVMAP